MVARLAEAKKMSQTLDIFFKKAARSTEANPQSRYMNYDSMVVVASFEETSVRNMIGVVNRLSVFFFAHPKRQKKLEEAIHNTQREC